MSTAGQPAPAGVALILADGAAATAATLAAAWPGWDARIEMVIAADGGARHAAALGRRIDRWVGDADSISPADLDALVDAGVDVQRASKDKDESDSELALVAAIDAGADAIVILGALGGRRLDHGVANVGLLGHPALAGRSAVLYDQAGTRVTLLVAPDASGAPVARDLVGREGDLVSLIPSGETAHGVTTEGLRYPLVREPLLLGRTRGVSNVRLVPRARVTLESGRLLVIETPVTVRP